MRKKFARVWWIENHQKDFIKETMIPKKYRALGVETTLKWNDFKTKKTILSRAKVLAIGGKYILCRKYYFTVIM